MMLIEQAISFNTRHPRHPNAMVISVTSQLISVADISMSRQTLKLMRVRFIYHGRARTQSRIRKFAHNRCLSQNKIMQYVRHALSSLWMSIWHNETCH